MVYRNEMRVVWASMYWLGRVSAGCNYVAKIKKRKKKRGYDDERDVTRLVPSVRKNLRTHHDLILTTRKMLANLLNTETPKARVQQYYHETYHLFIRPPSIRILPICHISKTIHLDYWIFQ